MARRTTGEGVTERRRCATWAIIWTCALGSIGCGSGAATAPAMPVKQVGLTGNVLVSWAANRETAVNRAGGGYRVYFSRTSGFSIAAAPFVDVPYAGGAIAPTRAGLSLPAGTHFIKVVAYSALNPAGSEPSAEVMVAVPSPAALARAP